MNVRFFGGTKKQYLSIPAPHNPLGLYFCEDTKELFWGDLLLTDGIRVVATKADLPSLDSAADGTVYYVTQTRNGYTLSPDRTGWLQTIYAPATDAYKVPETELYNTVTTVGAVRDIESKIYSNFDERIAELRTDIDSAGVKKISLAGIELTEVDNVFSIDRSCLRRAIGIKVPDGQEEAELDIATKDYVDAKIDSCTNIDLSKYYTKPEVNQLIPDTSEFITMQDIANKKYVTEQVLAAKGYLTEHQDLSAYAKTSVVNQLATLKKYEVLPIEGMFVSYRDGEVRVNTQHVDIASLPKQNAGDGSSDNYYYATFRAYAPEGATSVIEGISDKMDVTPSTLAVDSYGRKYTTIWAAIANKSGNTWNKFGDSSSINKYLGFYYNFHWYKNEQLIGTEKVRVILTNDNCHDDLVPDVVARRIDDKISTIQIPSTDDLVTKTELEEAISTIEHPTIDLSGYALKTDVAKKADEVSFKTDKFVTNAFGGFVVGDNVKGLSITEIFAKLLGLVDEIPQEPDEPVLPGDDATPEEIAEYLISNNLTIYSQDAHGNLTETPFTTAVWTKSEAAEQMDGISTIYQIADEIGNIIESGYQEYTEYNEEAWLTIALPSVIRNVKVKMFNPGTANWEDVNWIVVKADKQTIEGYTIWTVPEEYEVQSGDTYRFVIIN